MPYRFWAAYRDPPTVICFRTELLRRFEFGVSLSSEWDVSLVAPPGAQVSSTPVSVWRNAPPRTHGGLTDINSIRRINNRQIKILIRDFLHPFHAVHVIESKIKNVVYLLSYPQQPTGLCVLRQCLRINLMPELRQQLCQLWNDIL